MRKKYINSNRTDVNTVYYRDKKGRLIESSSTYRTTSEKKLSKFSLILGLLSLFVILSSMFLTGYVDSKYENSYVDEVKVIEYKKIVGYETGNKFDFLNTYDDFKQLKNYVLRIKQPEELTYDYNYFVEKYGGFKSCSIYNGGYYQSKNSFELPSPGVNTSNNFYLIEYYSNRGYIPNRTNDVYIAYINYAYTSNEYMYFHLRDTSAYKNNFDIEYAKDILNIFYDIDREVESIPIYETWFEYEYPTGYYDYDWNAKLNQLSKLRNVFNIGMIDFDKNLYYVNNYKYVRGVKNDGLQFTNYNLLFNDSNIQNLLPYCSVVLYQSWDEKIGSGKRDNYYLWYVYLNELDDNATYTQRKLWNYVKDNYITQYTLDNYINYYALKQYEGFYKFTQVLTFPISIINNLMYDFGVLVRFIVEW